MAAKSGSRWCTVVACILLLSCGAAEASYSANFFCTVGNERMNLDHSEYELPDKASYIVGVKELSEKQGVLDDLGETFDWKPQYEYATMSMFSGFLEQQQVQWLLQDDRIAYVECDGFVKVARKKDKELR
jgi:hypothetical protein